MHWTQETQRDYWGGDVTMHTREDGVSVLEDWRGWTAFQEITPKRGHRARV